MKTRISKAFCRLRSKGYLCILLFINTYDFQIFGIWLKIRKVDRLEHYCSSCSFLKLKPLTETEEYYRWPLHHSISHFYPVCWLTSLTSVKKCPDSQQKVRVIPWTGIQRNLHNSACFLLSKTLPIYNQCKGFLSPYFHSSEYNRLKYITCNIS